MTKISSWRDKYNGESCCIIGSGPGLKTINWRVTKSFGRTLAINAGVAWLEDKRNVFAILLDPTPFNVYGAEIDTVFTLTDNQVDPQGSKDVVRLVNLGKWQERTKYGFSFDLTKGVYVGDTSALTALQIAVYMGFTAIYFIGVDLADVDGCTHYDGNYNKSGDRKVWFELCQEAFHQAREVIPEHIKLYNCSPIRGPDALEKYIL